LNDFLGTADRIKPVWKGLSGQKGKCSVWQVVLEIDACASIIELTRRFILAAVFSLSVVIGIDILDTFSLYS
jgi:hypothetical protein